MYNLRSCSISLIVNQKKSTKLKEKKCRKFLLSGLRLPIEVNPIVNNAKMVLPVLIVENVLQT